NSELVCIYSWQAVEYYISHLTSYDSAQHPSLVLIRQEEQPKGN
ncbi:unnamed protein product, partial [Allacma fusca]